MKPNKRARRWVAVAIFVGLLTGLPPLISALPAKEVSIGPGKLFRAIRASSSVPYQGLAESNARLGLPDLQRAGRLASLLGERTRLRAWYRGPDEWRVDDLTPIGEHGTYMDGDGIWVWDSGRRSATRVEGFSQVRFPRAADLLPPELGRRLANGARLSEISALPSARVAGVNAAGMRITPRSSDTTVDWVNIWSDPATGLPLRVQIGARNTPGIVVSSSFLEVSETVPSRSVVQFQAPAGASLSRTIAPDFAQAVERYSPFLLPAVVGGRTRTTALNAAAVYGHGFDTLAVLALPDRYSPISHDELAKLRAVGGPWDYGALAQTPLLNGLVVETHGILYMLGGAVTPRTLMRTARTLVRRPLDVRRSCC